MEERRLLVGRVPRATGVDVGSYGTWSSPVSTSDVACALRLGKVRYGVDGALWWQETHPGDDDTVRIMRRSPNGESNEAWRGEWAVHGLDLANSCWMPVAHGGLVVPGEAGRHLYLTRPGSRGTLLTPEHVEGRSGVFTEVVRSPDPGEIWAVRESRNDGQVAYQLVAVPLDGSRQVRCLHTTGQPLSMLRPSPDGRLLAWVSWQAPQMPWDGSQLLVGSITDAGISDISTVIGGPVESVFQPEWASADSLYVVSDRSRWSNLYEVSLNGQLRRLAAWSEEFGWPQLGPDLSTYTRLSDGRLAVLHGTGEWRLDLLDPADGSVTPLDLPHTAWLPYLDAHGTTVAGVAGGPSETAALVLVDTVSGHEEVVCRSVPDVPAGYLPTTHSATCTGRDGHLVHATVFPPHNPHAVPDLHERVPYILFLSGGPGEQHTHMLDPVTVFFTSRGLGVVDLHCRGSSGFGRTYREHVYGQWGVADVEDCAVVARHLIEEWNADPARLVVRGAGAAGATALATVANSDVCAAAAVYGAITDLPGLGADPGQGVGRYLREIAADSTLLRTRAWLDRVRRPVLICHGEEDRLVPVGQAELLRDALQGNRVPHAYLVYEGEGHALGAESVSRALAAELSFYGQVLGFEPAEIPRVPLSAGPPGPG